MTSALWIGEWNRGASLWIESLFRASLQGGVALALVWVCCRAFPKMPAELRSWLWRLAYLKLLLVFFWTEPVDIPILPASFGPTHTVHDRALPGRSAASQVTSKITEPVTVSSDSPATAPSVLPETASLSLAGWLLLLWLAGALWQIIRLAGEGRACIWLRGLSEPIREEAALACRDELCDRLKLTKTPGLFVVQGAGSPALLGIVNPTVLFPSRVLERCSPSDFRRMLAHELAHWKRRDLLWGWLAALGRILFYFHPMEWLAGGEYRLAQEIACDTLALEITQDSAGDYAQTLLHVAAGQHISFSARLVTVGAVENPNELKRRMAAMKHFHARSSHNTLLISSTLAVIATFALLPWHLTSAQAHADVRPDVKPLLPPNAGGRLLRYKWQPGKTYVYAVRIESDTATTLETETGSAVYTVASANDDGMTLTCRGNLIPTSRSKAGHFPPLPSPLLFNRFRFGGIGSPFRAPNEVKIDRYGQILSARGDAPLPRALGELTELVIEPLPKDGEAQWQTSGGCTILLTEVHRLSPLSHFGREQTTRLPAQEKTTYSLGEAKGASVVIHKHYTLSTSDTIGGDPRIQIEGDGQITFDTQAGLPRSMVFKANMIEHPDENTTVKTPITLTYQLQEGQPGPNPPDGFKNGLATGPLHPVQPQRPELSDGDTTQALADLQSSDGFKRGNAVRKFEQSAPNGRRKEVTRALISLLGDKESFTRASAVKALAGWGGKDAVPALIKQLDDEAFNVRWAVFDALGTIKDARGAEPVAKWLKKDQGFASRSLQNMGSVAEPAVVKYLNDSDDFVVMEACHILKVIGTKSSVPALQTVAARQTGLAPIAAKEAMKAIAER